ncbi:MAG: hypothetical protein ISS89_03585 [Candidatus Omnitrophica bacterium]|nr:hypothetical protein [Candidatus Omnitrophota bacterium]
MRKYRLQPGVPVILIMGGGQGLGPIKKIVKSLETLNRDIQEIIVTGTNKKLYRSLKRKVKKSRKKILLFRYTDKINELMTVATVIITKPGGITTAEVLTKRIPMIIIKPLPGQEASNAAYLTEKKVAIRLEDPKEINVIMEELLAEPAKLKKLALAARNIGKPNASLDIARLLLHLS